VALDALIGDPRHGHPLALFGAAATRAERRLWADARRPGVIFTAAAVGAPTALGAVLDRGFRGRWMYPLVVASVTWAVLGGETLRREALVLNDLLVVHDLSEARSWLTHLVGRDTATLDEADMARAAVESVAENTSDAVVAPLFWGAVAGLPGLLGYRAVNTLDAMVGYRSERYRNFGWSAARLDDAANLIPARATALLVALVSGRPREVARVVRRDSGRHPSPNAGWCEAAFAGALHVQLGGVNVYGDRVEERPSLGDGKPPQADDVQRAAALARHVGTIAALLAAAWSWRRR
jgi:adenosylcobinamide-phosphate synthase